MSNVPAILYIEDEEGDVLLMRLAVKRASLPASLQIAADGIQAIDYLAGSGSFSNRNEHPLPCLVLLDLKLPRCSGFEVLAWVRQQPQFATLPVIAYTSSCLDTDHAQACQLGATDYVVKMSDVNAIAQWLRTLAHHLQPQPTTT